MTRQPMGWHTGLRLALVLVGLLATLAAPTPPVAAGDGTTDTRAAAWASQASVASTLGTTGRERCWLTAAGSLVCRGGTDAYQALDTPPPGPFAQVSVGTDSICGVKNDGTLVCWQASRQDLEAPLHQIPTERLPTPPATDGFRQVSVGMSHICGVKTDGSILCWGDNRFGQLAVPTPPPATPPPTAPPPTAPPPATPPPATPPPSDPPPGDAPPSDPPPGDDPPADDPPEDNPPED